MKYLVMFLLFIAPLLISATLVAEFIETACIETDFAMSMSMMDTDSTFCMYAWGDWFQPTSQIRMKRLHADGSQEAEQVIYEFDAAAGDLFTLRYATNHSSGYYLFFRNSTGMRCLVLANGTIQAYHLPSSTIANSYCWRILDGSVYFIGSADGISWSLCKWTLATGDCSFVYDVSAFSAAGIAVFGDRLVLSEFDQYMFEPLPVVVFDPQLNPTLYYGDIHRIEDHYGFDEYTYYATWQQTFGLSMGGLVTTSADTLAYEQMLYSDGTTYFTHSFDFMFRLSDSIHGAWYRFWDEFEGDNEFRLFQHHGIGEVSPYSAFPVQPGIFDQVVFAADMRDFLVLIDYQEGDYSYRVADLASDQWIHSTENQWQDTPDGYYVSQHYFSDDYLVEYLSSLVWQANSTKQIRFLKLNLSTSTDDPLNPPPALTAYPNPFKDVICISGKNLQARQGLIIYNLRGQKVRSIAGSGQAYEWDGRDDLGRSLGAGIYFARESGSKQTLKLVKLKQ
nr:T9SS type A sorting domain-containing protein [Methanocorpusculum sp. GPch4]